MYKPSEDQGPRVESGRPGSTPRTRIRWYRMALAAVVTALLAGCQPGRPTVETHPTATHETASARTEPRQVEGIRFESVGQTSGVDYRWPQQRRPLRILDTMGAGCAFLDYDNDGWQDILLVAQPHILLFHNERNGHFQAVTHTVGLESIRGDWRGAAVGDFDGDGYLDVLLTGYHCLALLRNEGGARFKNVTASAGLDPHNRGHWASSAGFMDLKGNGRLDLVLLNYVDFGPHDRQLCEAAPGIPRGCTADTYRAEYPELWENLGNGSFKEVTRASGMKDSHGRALVLAFADVDHDGRMDFYVGNDGTPAELMRNLGGLRFQNTGISHGAAYGEIGHAIAAMGADWGDYDRDGWPDLVVTAFSDEPFSLLHNTGKGLFQQMDDEVGLSGATYKALGFGAKWIDVDNDGWPDLVFADGHVYDTSTQTDPLSPLQQPLMLFRNEKGKHFTNLAPQLGGDLAKPILGRGLASGDFDNDGRVDFLAVDYEGESLLFHNLSQTANHWITLDLHSPGPNHFALGAEITARAGKQVWVGQVSPASSYLSSSDPRVHFGLGPVSTLDSLSIRWPDGAAQLLHNVRADQILRVEEGRKTWRSMGE